jgi:hypothetical protein
MAHASDANGVSGFEFSVDGELERTESAGGARMETWTYEWQPPGPGGYRIEVRGVDANGIVGPFANANVLIVGADGTIPADEVEIPTETPTGTSEMATGTATATITATFTLPPTATGTNTPTVTRRPPTAIPTNTQRPTDPPPPPDTTPPEILATAINPGQILVAGSGCESSPRTAESTVIATDEGGISTVYAKWYVLEGGTGTVLESGHVDYLFVNPDFHAWQATFGPVNHEGTMEIRGTVMDNANNPASFFHTISVGNCIL